MRRFSAVALTAILFGSILTAWVPARWAVAALQIAVFVLGGAWNVRSLIRPVQLQWSIVLIPLAGTVVWGGLQLVTHQTIYAWETWNAVLFWGTNLTLFFLALQVFSDVRLRDGFLRALLLFGFILSIVSILQLFTAEGKVFWLFQTEYKDFVLGPFVYRNQYAAFIELVLPLALFAALSDAGRMFAWVLVAVTMYASVIAAASRAGFALVSLEVIVTLAIALRRRHLSIRRLTTISCIFIGMLAILVVAVGPEVLWKRFELPNPYAIRREFLYSSVDMIRARPWMGFGLGTWSTAYPAYAYFDNGLYANQAHNDWAQWACEGGLPFLMLILWVAVWSVRPAVRSLWGLGVLSVFLHCLVDYPIQRPALWSVFAVLLGMLANGAQDSSMTRKIA